ADRRRLRVDRSGAGADDAAGEPPPAAVEHRKPVRPRQRDRQAIGDEDEGGEPGAIDDVSVELGRVSGRIGPQRRLLRLLVTGDRRRVDLAPDHDTAGVDPGRGAEPYPVGDDPIALVAGQDPEVEAAPRTLADAAETGREDGARPGEA